MTAWSVCVKGGSASARQNDDVASARLQDAYKPDAVMPPRTTTNATTIHHITSELILEHACCVDKRTPSDISSMT